MGDILQDFRYGARMLRKRPGTATLAIVALALGIGLTTAMFSVVNGVFLRGLPFEDAGRIVYVGADNLKKPGRPNSMPVQDFLDLKSQQASLDDIAGMSSFQATVSELNGVPMRYGGVRLTSNALAVLRIQPAQGRDFSDADLQPGAERVVLISHEIWLAQFLGAADIVGKVVRINNEPATVIGVMPERFGFPDSARVWVPLPLVAPAARSDGERVGAFGRLRRGVSLETANRELALIAGRLAAQYPENKDRTLTAMPFLRRFIAGAVVNLLSTMLAAVFGVLLIACVNVANLQLARAAERGKEVAVQLAIGASRGRIVRQMLCEGLLVSSIGGVAGLGLAMAGVIFINRGVAIDDTPPFWVDIRLDPTVLFFATALAVTAAVVSTLLPALRATRGALATAMHDEFRGSTSVRVGRFSRGLVMGQVMLSFTLLFASGLIVKSIAAASTIVLPFRADILAARLTLDAPAYRDDKTLSQAMERIRTRVMTGGIDGATFGSSLPSFTDDSTRVQVEGQTVDPSSLPGIEHISVGPDYFRVMRMPIVRGRAFGVEDRFGNTPVAIVTRDFADIYLAGGDPIGRRFRAVIRGDNPPPPVWLTIVGVAPPAVNTARNGVAASSVFVPADQFPARTLDLLMTTSGNPQSHEAAVRRAVADIDPAIAVYNVNSGQGRLDRIVWPVRIFGGLFTTFGVAALILAGAGLYGVMAFAVRRRTQEIGVRLALGATSGDILQMVLRQGSRLLLGGIALGLGAGLFLATLLTQLLFQVEPWDPSVVIATLAVLTTTGLIACAVPARRAAAVDPLVALRRD